MLPLTIADALKQVQQIPCVEEIFDTAHTPFMTTLLEATHGYTITGVKVYRVYMAAMRYIQQSPDNWRIKKHHKTELNDFSQAIEMLAQMQRAQDDMHDLIIPIGQEPDISPKRGRLVGSYTLTKDNTPP